MTKKTKVSIIITAEKKENYIERAIKSCINQSYNNIETIVVYTELTNNRILKKKFSSKKIKFLNIREKLKIPTQDQLFKIYKSLKFSKGQYIFLMDGDDAFQKNKVSSILKNKSKSILIKDHYEYSAFSRQLLRFMDFVGNYYNGVNVPKKYFTKNSIANILKKSNLKLNKEINDYQYYSKMFLFFSNPKLHFIKILKK